MPAEPIKIPQNVYIEDKVVGPLTLRQILVMTAGGGFSYILMAMAQKSVGQMNIVLTALCWMPFVITAAFALIKINDLTLTRIVFLLMERSYKSPIRTFAPRQGICINIRFSSQMKTPEEEEKERQKKIAEAKSQTKIEELSKLIDLPPGGIEETPGTMATALPATEPVAEFAAHTQDDADEDNKPLALPVDPSRIAVDGKKPGTTLSAPPLSDLSVFRDIFSPRTQ